MPGPCIFISETLQSKKNPCPEEHGFFKKIYPQNQDSFTSCRSSFTFTSSLTTSEPVSRVLSHFTL